MPSRRTTWLLAVALAAGCVLIVTSATAAPGTPVAQCHPGAASKTCVASGDVRRPKALYVQVTSRPHQRVTGRWSVVCTRNTVGRARGGRFSAVTPTVQRLRKPFRNNDACSFSANARLRHGGNLNVTLRATH